MNDNSAWSAYLLQIALTVASKSKDTSTKVGAVIADSRNRIVSTGYNGFPHGVKETPERMERPLKYKFVVHAEMNAIATAANRGIALDGCKLYTTLPPCHDCLKMIASCGIKEVHYLSDNQPAPKSANWRDDLKIMFDIANEAGITLIEHQEEL